MPILGQRSLTRSKIEPARYPFQTQQLAVRLPGGFNSPAGTVMAEIQIAARNEVQTITIGGTPTGGTFTVGLDGINTAPIAFNATAAQVKTALEALVGVGNITSVTGGPGPGTPYVVTFGGEFGNVDVSLMSSSLAGLTGGTPTLAVAETTKGSPGLVNAYDVYNDAGSNGAGVAKGILIYNTQTDAAGRIKDEFGVGTENNAPVFIAGSFLCSDLTGLDANGVADLGVLEDGSAFSVAGAIIKLL